ncbi:MAG: tetratricopeptide repeat protein, partial [Victivallales bacterium]|nr:tetratricopeptide repeat protein [Victivallales bacterium]
GDLKTAELNFIKVIQRDQANETAYMALAEIAEKNNNPALAAAYWKIAAKLDPLSENIAGNYLAALLKSYQYSAVYKLLEKKNVDKLSDFELYALTKASYYQNPLMKTQRLLQKLLERKSSDPRIVLLHADTVFASGNPEKAITFFQSLINNADKKIRTEALIGLGQCNLAMKKSAAAGEYFRKAAEISPDSADVLMFLGNYNLISGDYKLAESQFTEMHRNFPDNLSVTIVLAEIYARNKNAAGIKKLLNHIKSETRAAIAAKYYLHSLLAYLANNPAELKKNLAFCELFRFRPLYTYLKFPEILMTNDTSRITRYVAELRRIDDSPAARADLCRQLERLTLADFRKGEFEKAAALGQILCDLQPGNPAFAHLAMVCAFNRQQWYKAVAAADEFNKLQPDTLDYLRIKGRSLLLINDAAKALPLLEKLAAIDSKNPESWLWFAQACGLSGKEEKLFSCLDRLLQLPPNAGLYPAVNDAAAFLLAENDLKAAALIADKLLLSPDSKLQALGFSVKAQLAQKNQQLPKAVEFMEKACSLVENNDRILYISDLYFDAKDYNKALVYVKKVLKKSPEDPKALYRQALIYQTLAEYDKAAAIYRKLLEKYPQWSLVLVNLSDIAAAQGKFKEALVLAQQAQEKSPLWPRGKLCLAMREMDCKNYSTALRILELLQAQEPDNEFVRKAIAACLLPLAAQHLENQSFAMAKLRLKQFQRLQPGSKEAAALEKGLDAAIATAEKKQQDSKN